MKFKKYINKIKNEEYEIPNIHDEIRPYYESRKLTYFKPTRRINLSPVLKFAFVPVLIIGFIIAIKNITSFLPKDNDSDMSKGYELSYFNNYQEINDLLLDNNYRESKFNEKFTSIYQKSSSTNNINNKNNADIVTTENNLIYYANSSTINVIKTNQGNMELIFSDNFASYEQRQTLYQRKELIYLTNDYIILIYNDYTEFSLNNAFTKFNINIVIYNKTTFEKISTYQVFGNYLDSKVINNTLYIITNSNINEYSNVLEGTLPLPQIFQNKNKKDIQINDIGYIKGLVGNTYTVLTTISLTNPLESNEKIILSCNWNNVYFSSESLYLINTYKNYDENNYGDFTSFIKFKYNQNYLQYRSAYSFNGVIIKQSAFNEDNQYLRIAATEYNYKIDEDNIIRKTGAFNKIIILQERSNDSFFEYKVIDELKEGLGYSIKSSRFDLNNLRIITENDILYDIDLSNQKITIMNTVQVSSTISKIEYLDMNNAYSIRKINSEYFFHFYSVNNYQVFPYSQGEFAILNNYFGSYSDWIDVEAVENPYGMYTRYINGDYYLGFSVHEEKEELDSYLLFEIDLDTESYSYHDFTNQNYEQNGEKYMITRMITSNDNLYFYTISDKRIISYNKDYIEISICDLNL